MATSAEVRGSVGGKFRCSRWRLVEIFNDRLRRFFFFFRTLRKLLIHILSCHKLFCFTFFSIPIYNITYHSCSFVGASLAKYFTLPTNGLHSKFDTA